MKLHKGDTVLIIAGKDKGKRGKIVKSFPKEGQVLVEGVNIRKKHTKPKKGGEKGQVIQREFPTHISNVKMICPKCGSPARTGYKIIKGQKNAESPQGKQMLKVRVCKKCEEEI